MNDFTGVLVFVGCMALTFVLVRLCDHLSPGQPAKRSTTSARLEDSR